MKALCVVLTLLLFFYCSKHKFKKSVENTSINNKKYIEDSILNTRLLDTVSNIKNQYISNLDSKDDDMPLRLIDTLIHHYLNRHTNNDIFLIDSFSCHLDGYVSEYFYLKLNEFDDFKVKIILNDMFLLRQNNKSQSCLEQNFILCFSMFGRKDYILRYIDNYLKKTKDNDYIIYLNELKKDIQ